MFSMSFLILVWLTKWSSDKRAIGPTDPTWPLWRNIYMSVYGALGVFQGMFNNHCVIY